MSEHTEQCALFEFAARVSPRYPELRLLYAVPNGGKRTRGVAGKLKAEGVKSGIPDMVLPVARLGFHGFYLELKIEGKKPTKAQVAWLDALSEQGYCVDVSYGWQEAAHKLIRYLGGEPSEVGL